jgi:hypothetical protein
MRLHRMAMETMPVDRAWLDIGRWRRIKPGGRVKARCAGRRPGEFAVKAAAFATSQSRSRMKR